MSLDFMIDNEAFLEKGLAASTISLKPEVPNSTVRLALEVNVNNYRLLYMKQTGIKNSFTFHEF